MRMKRRRGTIEYIFHLRTIPTVLCIKEEEEEEEEEILRTSSCSDD